MPYGDLERQAAQRFASFQDLDREETTLEEREEYEPYVRMGMPVFAGVDYVQVLTQAEAAGEVVVWDGGNNDFPFVRPDLQIAVLDPHRLGHETSYHPGEVNFRAGDVYVINKVDSAPPRRVGQLRRKIRALKPRAPIVLAESKIMVEDETAVRGKRVVIVGTVPR